MIACSCVLEDRSRDRLEVPSVLHILALVFIGALIWVSILSIPLFLVGGLRWEDIRSLLLHYAYGSFIFEADVIPGVRPSLGTRLVICTFSREDDARRALVTRAIAIAEQRKPPRGRKVRLLLLRMSAGMGQSWAASRALQQSRWFTAPVTGARFRARCAGGAPERAW